MSDATRARGIESRRLQREISDLKASLEAMRQELDKETEKRHLAEENVKAIETVKEDTSARRVSREQLERKSRNFKRKTARSKKIKTRQRKARETKQRNQSVRGDDSAVSPGG